MAVHWIIQAILKNEKIATQEYFTGEYLTIYCQYHFIQITCWLKIPTRTIHVRSHVIEREKYDYDWQPRWELCELLFLWWEGKMEEGESRTHYGL